MEQHQYKKGRLRSKQPTTKFSKNKRIKTYNNHPTSDLFTFIDISRKQKQSPPSAFIRLCTLRYIRQDRVGNGGSERIQSVLCEDTLREKRIIVVRGSLL